MIPIDYMADKQGLLPPAHAFNLTWEGGMLVFNTCELMERMLVKNVESVGRSDDMPKLLNGFGGTSYIFSADKKLQNCGKKNQKAFLKGDNQNRLDQLIRDVTLKRLQWLQT